MTKRSTEIFAELNEVLARIRQLHAEAEASQPLRFNRNLSDTEQWENERRRDKIDQLTRDVAKAEAEATQLRKAYNEAMTAEQAPKVEEASEKLKALYAKRDELKQTLDQTRDARSQNALAAAEGNAKARTKVDGAFDAHAAGIIQLSNLNLAIEAAEQRDAEARVASAEAAADQKYAAALAAGQELTEWAAKMENLLGYVSGHQAKLDDLRKKLAKTGADIDTVKTNTMFGVATFDRAAKAAGLHRCLSIDTTVNAASMAEQFRSLLKVAIRRPNKGKRAA